MTARDCLLRAARARSLRQSGTVALVLVLAALAVAALAACGGDGDPEPPPPTEALSAEDAELAAHLSEKTMLLWEYYNNYDLESLRTLYEPNYWLSEEEELEHNMEPFEKRNIKFTAEETSPPTEIEPGIWQVKHKARFSGGSLNMKFLYEQFDGEWLLTHAELD